MSKITPFHFPAFVESNRIQDCDLKHSLPLELFLRHEGYRIIIGGKAYKLHIYGYDEHPKDHLMLDICSYKDSGSIGAKHYEGSLILPSVMYGYKEKGKDRLTSSSAWPGLLMEIELTRPLTAEEMEEGPQRWGAYELGEMVIGFNELDSLAARANQIAKTYFPGFKLKSKREYVKLPKMPVDGD